MIVSPRKLAQLTDLLLEEIRQEACGRPRRYGFEIEFLPQEVLTPERVQAIKSLLPQLGFVEQQGRFASTSGLFVTFEPGGQIEYGSPPLAWHNSRCFSYLLGQIEATNQAIAKRLGVVYLAQGYAPGRGDAPLCLDASRYHNLHRRLGFSGSRGREMMKGTASIHLHVSFHSPEEMLLLYRELCDLAQDSLFEMSPERRDIWDNTDPRRCGIYCQELEHFHQPRDFLRALIRRVLQAEDLYTDRPAWQSEPLTYEYLKEHLTTIFTDLRLNLKGPTLELRTPDSRPQPEFEHLWWSFVSQMEEIGLPLSCTRTDWAGAFHWTVSDLRRTILLPPCSLSAS